MPKSPIIRRGLVAAGLGAYRSVDQFGQVMRDFDIRTQAEEDIAALAGLVLLAPDPAIAEMRDGADAVVERDSLLAPGFIDAPFARRCANVDVGQRQVVAIEQFGDLGGGG